MASRLKLHEELCEILESRNVYFQPPESTKMEYRCIKYSISAIDQKHADDLAYRTTNRYEVILIDYDPDSDWFDVKIRNRFPMCRFERWYSTNNLNHFVYSIYY